MPQPPLMIDEGRSLPALDARFYWLCQKHGIVPPIGPDGPPPQVEEPLPWPWAA